MIHSYPDEVAKIVVDLDSARQRVYAEKFKMRRFLLDALEPLAKIPYEDFGEMKSDDHPLMGWNGHIVTVGDVRRARAALALVTARLTTE